MPWWLQHLWVDICATRNWIYIRILNKKKTWSEIEFTVMKLGLFALKLYLTWKCSSLYSFNSKIQSSISVHTIQFYRNSKIPSLIHKNDYTDKLCLNVRGVYVLLENLQTKIQSLVFRHRGRFFCRSEEDTWDLCLTSLPHWCRWHKGVPGWTETEFFIFEFKRRGLSKWS